MFQKEVFIQGLEGILEKSDINFDVPMKNHTTFRVGGNAEIFVTPESYEEVRNIIKLCKTHNMPYYIFGKGSNILVKDGGIKGVVIKLTKLKNISFEENKAIAQCGASLIEVSLAAAEKSLKGLEFASGIPGTVGGAVAMNAGAYDGDISKVIESALVIDDKGNIISLNKEELELTYRNSIVSRKGYIVLEATYSLEKGDYAEIKEKIAGFSKMRREKQPLEYPSAGSTFKRPEGYFAGKLIQDSGLKGYSIGEAQVSEKHSGFVINKGNATATEILELIHKVQDIVYNDYNVTLETEVKILGED
ncbi:UDP-N-acetylmuramate dehydrogenase [Clostridium collagenovorans DSM 3089]|uniref:UDP-N-acetylenolpyruvoylglucosamine reductase n=1 Tax=Clostridium collagenovorans DSM 3089 TaxID=1121306 RepID=A0A1M5WYB9_9CLOT|nr:UDP-N-acetylmuramate dehydrogenase [Clostridium collagenovorans]SHH92547.1 UDP-N-acetylmuramate dehydrogenase [Clostridium collagenovorans DSM 3089]